MQILADPFSTIDAFPSARLTDPPSLRFLKGCDAANWAVGMHVSHSSMALLGTEKFVHEFRWKIQSNGIPLFLKIRGKIGEMDQNRTNTGSHIDVFFSLCLSKKKEPIGPSSVASLPIDHTEPLELARCIG